MKVKDIIKQTKWIPNADCISKPPRFSVFMPTFRRAKSGHLERAIQSVLGQTYRDWELIVIDDASTDGSHQIIKEFMLHDRRVHLLHHPQNVGLPAVGCYEALLRSRGSYFCFCFDDTEWDKDALRKANEFFEKTNARVAYGYINLAIPLPGGAIGNHIFGREPISQGSLAQRNFIPNMGVIIHREVPDKVGFIDPHFAVARVNDWDYWYRLSKRYQIRQMDVCMGIEYGVVTNNSLGATYPISCCLADEWKEIPRDQMLLPGNYEEYDVQRIPTLTDASRLAALDLKRFYSEKFWFRKNECEIDAVEPKKHNRILVIESCDVSASTAMPFQELTSEGVRLCTTALDPAEMSFAQAIVVCRAIFHPSMRRYLAVARAMEVPMYYYFDDNFPELRSIDRSLEEYTVENLRSELKDFAGILVPNEKLLEFCKEQGLHDSVYLTPPYVKPLEWYDTPMFERKGDNAIRVCFMGGGHRRKAFEQTVVPAIQRLAETKRVELVFVGSPKLDLRETRNLKIYNVPFDISYFLTIGRLANAEIDILIHSGSSSEVNNEFKTPNALINAWHLGAVPVLAEQAPYLAVEAGGYGLLADNDDPTSWLEKIQEAILPSTREKISSNLNLHLEPYLSGETSRETIQTIFRRHPLVGFATIELRNTRYSGLMTRELDRASVASNAPSACLQSSSDHQSMGCNGFTELRGKSSVYYDIVCKSDGWKGINFRIGTFNRVGEGSLLLKVRDNRGFTVTSKKFELGSIVDNQILRCEFPPIYNSAGGIFRVEFCHNPKIKGAIAIYEENRSDRGIRKLLKRMKVVKKGRSLACSLVYDEH